MAKGRSAGNSAFVNFGDTDIGDFETRDIYVPSGAKMDMGLGGFFESDRKAAKKPDLGDITDASFDRVEPGDYA